MICEIVGCFGTIIDTSFGFHDVFVQLLGHEFSPRTGRVWRIAWATLFLDDLGGQERGGAQGGNINFVKVLVAAGCLRAGG